MMPGGNAADRVCRWAINVVIARIGIHVVIDDRGGCDSKKVSSQRDEESWKRDGVPGPILAVFECRYDA